jgi:hypothetical protein
MLELNLFYFVLRTESSRRQIGVQAEFGFICGTITRRKAIPAYAPVKAIASAKSDP